MEEKLETIRDALTEAETLPEGAQDVIIAYAKGLAAGMKAAQSVEQNVDGRQLSRNVLIKDNVTEAADR